jgi:hypothetical protein
MFHTLAGHWQPVVPSLRHGELAATARNPQDRKERKSSLPASWSPWLNVK